MAPGHRLGSRAGCCPKQLTSLLRVIDQYTHLSIHLEVPIGYLLDPGPCGKGESPSSCPPRAYILAGKASVKPELTINSDGMR